MTRNSVQSQTCRVRCINQPFNAILQLIQFRHGCCKQETALKRNATLQNQGLQFSLGFGWKRFPEENNAAKRSVHINATNSNEIPPQPTMQLQISVAKA